MTISGNSINIKDGYLILPASRTYLKVLNDHKIKIRFPERLVGKKINEVKIIPQYNGRYFKIAYCYEINFDTQTFKESPARRWECSNTIMEVFCK